MERPLNITSVVAAYTLVEVALLLSVDVPHSSVTPSPYQLVIVWGQLLVIPGFAALLSRVMYGPRQLLRRTLTILLAGLFGPPIAVVSFGVLILPMAWAADTSAFLFAIVCPVITIAALYGLMFLVRKAGGWGVQAEAERWLTERQAGTTPQERRARIRSIRFSVCIPSITVLAVFLFLPEIWGALSHLGSPEPGRLSGYRATIPETSTILFHGENSDGTSWVTALSGTGIGLGGNPFRYDSYSSWSISTAPFSRSEETEYDRWMPKPDEVKDRQVLKVDNEELVCLDYRPTYEFGPDPGESATIRCLGSERLQATFYGARRQVTGFYRMLAGIKQVR